MLVAGNEPRIESVALGTVTAESVEVRIPAIVTSRAVQGLARGGRVELIGASNAQPSFQRPERGGAVGVTARRAGQGPRADLGEFHMIHHQRPNVPGLMLDVTRRTLLDARVELRRLATEQSLSVRMACRALGDRHADGRLVARCASIAEVCVPTRQRARADELL